MITRATELRAIEVKGEPNTVAFDATGKTVLYGSFGPPRRFDLASGKRVATFDEVPTGNAGGVCWCIAAPDGKRVVGAQYDAVAVWDRDGKLKRHILGPGGIVGSVAITPDGKQALAGTWEKQLVLFDLSTGKQLWAATDKKSFAGRVAISPDGKIGLSGGNDKSVRTWDLATGKQIGLLGTHGNYVQGLAVLPDGQRALSGSRDKTLILWDLKASKSLRTFTGHKKEILGVAILPDGERAISVGGDGALVWDLESGEALATFTDHGKAVTCVAVSPDGKTAITGGNDGHLRQWALP